MKLKDYLEDTKLKVKSKSWKHPTIKRQTILLNSMTDAQIAEYVNTKYKPGILNPFMDTSLYIKH